MMYKVFLVDDEEIALEQAERSIPWMENGFMVSGTESDPVCAMERIIKERPHVVFADLRMPRMDGLEMMRQINERGFAPEFVMLSAHSDFENVRISFKQGGFDYILKPFQPEEMEILLESLGRRLSGKFPLKNITDQKHESGDSFDALIDYLSQNFTMQHTLDSLSKKFGLSSSYICHHFSERYNTSLISFITRLRMEQAKRLILTENEPFKKIAVLCGYSDYFYFSKVFKGYFGVSPSKFVKDEKN